MDTVGDKATKTRPSVRDQPIDRRSRPRSPRSPRPLQHHQDEYASANARGNSHNLDYGNDSRGSTYGNDSRGTAYGNESRGNTSHGQKRRHDEDRRRDPYRSDRSYHSSARHDRYDDRAPPEKRHHSDRQPRRSRSPQRNREHIHFNRAYEPGHVSRRSSASSTIDKASMPTPSDTSGPRAEPTSTMPLDETDHVEPVVVDEAKLIEERRKRREALRAKHRGQNTPLLQKALETNAASIPQSPSTSSVNGATNSGKRIKFLLHILSLTPSQEPLHFVHRLHHRSLARPPLQPRFQSLTMRIWPTQPRPLRALDQNQTDHLPRIMTRTWICRM